MVTIEYLEALASSIKDTPIVPTKQCFVLPEKLYQRAVEHGFIGEGGNILKMCIPGVRGDAMVYKDKRW